MKIKTPLGEGLTLRAQCRVSTLTKLALGKENEEMKKIKLQILVVCLVVILTGSSCGKNQFNSVIEQTPGSALSSMLLETSDLSGNWKWTFSNIIQGPATPSLDNNLSTEIASSSLAGDLFIDEKKYTFTIYHSVQNYDQSTPYVSPPFTDGAFPEPFALHLVEVGDEMEFDCSKLDVKSGPIFFCGILIKYKSIESILRITGDVNAGEPLIEEVINEILVAVNTHIEANQ
jgi:hypothetical protein